jgi:hypothetical protein
MSIIKCTNSDCHYFDLADQSDNCSHPYRKIQECHDAVVETEQDVTPSNFYYKELRSDGCFCGKEKKPGFSFCYPCYSELPEELRSNLWLKMGEGYEEAYDEAMKFLEED